MLRNGEKKIGSFPDLCIEDREKEKKLKADLKIKRGNNEREWFIKVGKLCRRDF